jgi:hypothetical protein
MIYVQCEWGGMGYVNWLVEYDDPDFPDKIGVRSTHLIQLGRGNGNGKVVHPAIRVDKLPAVRAYSNSRIRDQSWAWDRTDPAT